MVDFNACAFRHVKGARAVKIVRQHPDPACLRVDRGNGDNLDRGRGRNDRSATPFRQTKRQQFLLQPRDLLDVERLHRLVGRGRIDGKVRLGFFNLDELRGLKARTGRSKADRRIAVFVQRRPGGDVIDRCGLDKIDHGQARRRINLGEQNPVPALAGDDAAVVDHLAKGFGATLAVTGAYIAAAKRACHRRGPVGGLGHANHTHIAPAIGVQIDVRKAFQPRARLDVNAVVGLVQSNGLQI